MRGERLSLRSLGTIQVYTRRRRADSLRLSMPSSRLVRILVLCLLVCGIGLGAAWLRVTPTGHEILHHPRTIGQHLYHWVRMHPIHALLSLFGLYIALTLLALPVWSLQVMCGYATGLLWGVIWCQLAATIAAVITFHFSRWLAADWFHKKVEAKMARLRSLDEKLGHNGFLVVMAVRLIHVMPFALSNYAFGLTKITARDIVVGTLLGGIPGVAIYVTVGAQPHLMETWKFWGYLVLLNALLLIPLGLRYIRPQWFKRIGVE
jgi:uncharacterized membrane protein YdjX (TVP38/TMEM64 family)